MTIPPVGQFPDTTALRATAPLFLIAGPCIIQSEDLTLLIAQEIRAVTQKLGIPAIFKASFDKANRSSGSGFRGPGADAGLGILQRVGQKTGLPLLTDIHHPEQAAPAAEVCQILQIPAFLCRQTDLIEAAAKACPIINVKKGQFLAPENTRNIVAKARAVRPDSQVWLCERGTTFGYGNLVVDMRSLPIMSQWADAVIFDATHSLQLPGAGAGGERTGGQREFIFPLAQAAVATGAVHGVFLEVHPEPAQSPSDADNILPLDDLEPLLRSLLGIARLSAEKT